MGGFSLRSLTFMLIIVLLIWSSNVEICSARRVGRHWRKNRRASDSLFKKKGKNHGSNHHNSNGGKSKQKVPSPPPLPPRGSGSKKAPPVTPPEKGVDKSPPSTVFNVLHFGAKGDGRSDDTKVTLISTQVMS